MSPEALLRPALCAVVLYAFGACAPAIGDECKTSLDCSSQGSRLCNRTQPHGYCTLRGCESGTCPEDSVCVKFRPEQERLATTWCMATCSQDGDCRSDEGYQCTTAEGFGAAEAEILGREGQRFCSSTSLMSLPEPEPNEPEPNEPEPNEPEPNEDGGGAATDDEDAD